MVTLDQSQVVSRLREHLRLLAISDRSIRNWGPHVSEETKAARLAENAVTRAAVERRLAELSGADAVGGHPPL